MDLDKKVFARLSEMRASNPVHIVPIAILFYFSIIIICTIRRGFQEYDTHIISILSSIKKMKRV